MRTPFVRRPLVVLLLLGLAAFPRTRADAQPQLDSLEKLRAAYGKHSEVITKLEMGQLQPGKEHHEAMDVLAKYLVYRYVSSPPPDEKKLDLFHKDFQTH